MVDPGLYVIAGLRIPHNPLGGLWVRIFWTILWTYYILYDLQNLLVKQLPDCT